MCSSIDPKVTAVDSRNLYLSYSKGTSKVIALNNLSLSIPSGCIFCLIGPSGCGKTSYLRSLIGLIKTESGSTTIFGYPLGHRDLMIPGRGLGYMPQADSLNDDLTIGEMLSYFNRLLNTYSSSASPINKVIDLNRRLKTSDDDFLANLSLPSEDTLIGSLSGGQKRRVSFLCSILHSPKLIILDEPTVGCDPIVINSMWKILHSITSSEQSTIIITTHYLEEARKTDMIGFMRKGQLLEKGSPAQVLNRLSVNSIEAAFALMCQRYKKNKLNRSANYKHRQSNANNKSVDKNAEPSSSQQVNEQNFTKSSTNLVNTSSPPSSSPLSVDWFRDNLAIPLIVYLQLTYAITHRLCVRQFKVKLLLVGPMLAIVLLVALTSVSTGGTPVVTIGVINNEQENNGSQIFLDQINQQLIHLVAYNSTESARHDSLTGQLSGYLIISSQFTDKLVSKYSFTENDLTDLEPALVYHGDTTRSIVLAAINFQLESALDDSLYAIINQSDLNPILSSPFALIVDPIGKAESPIDLYNSRNYWMPKFIGFWSFTVTIMLSSFTFYRDRNEPLYERNLSSGTTQGQFVIGHFITSMLLPLANSWPVIAFAVHVIGLKSKGPLALIWLIYISNCSTAITTSFLISSAPIDIAFIFILDAAYVFSGLTSTGTLWPFEALPYFLKPYKNLFPFVVNSDSLLRIISHGHSWDDSLILWGLAQNLGYNIIVLMLVRFILTLQ